jgi:hypothetical protein
MNSKPNQTLSKFVHSKRDLLELETFEIKYGCEGFEIRNNVP